ncbi:MAG: nucleotidyltransferase family protein [Ignavibacteriales bacterium]|nr:nucleotidyltransferase family protein [Ignavibacteriales bacterium]
MTQAMILCTGYGTRMKEYTREIPKPMLPIDNKPMIEYTIRHLERLGIRDLVINLHYMPDSITSYFENGRKFNVNIAYSYEESALGTAGAVKKAENLLKSENFLVIYGDIITNLNFNDMIKFHKDNQEAVGTIILHERLNPTA